jgi:hypothetical protein
MGDAIDPIRVVEQVIDEYRSYLLTGAGSGAERRGAAVTGGSVVSP